MKFFLSRFVQAVIVMFSVATALFILVRLVPGNPAQVIAGPDASRQTVLDIEREYELNRSVPVQYLHWLGQLLTGHLGESVIYQVGVASLIRQAIPATVQLLIGGMFIALVLGIVLGVVAAINARKAPDFLVGVGTALALGMPAFWTGILAIIVFAVKLHWLPAGGFVSVTVNPVEGMKDLVLPCLVLGSFVGSYLARFVRSGMLEALDSDFVRTARAKGLPERTVIFRHALRSALVPLLTVIGIQVGLLIGGAVVIEDVFAMPGIGSLVITAISQRDYPVIQGGVLVLVAAFSAVNLLVDLLYSVADPAYQAVMSEMSETISTTEDTRLGQVSSVPHGGSAESPWRRAIRRFVRQPAGVIGAFIIVGYVVMAAAAPWLAPHNPLESFSGLYLKGPSWQFLLGTDEIGRDILSRIIYGARPALEVSFGALLIGLVVGVFSGLAAGFFPSPLTKAFMRVWDGVITVPAILMGIILAATFDSGTTIVAVAAGLAAAPMLARVARAAVLAEVERGYVESARALGLTRRRIFLSHVVPNAMRSVVVQLALTVSGAILLETALAYVGVSAPPPTPDWGAMLADSHGYLTIAWWYGLFPGLAVVILVLGVNMLADATRDALDPRGESQIR